MNISIREYIKNNFKGSDEAEIKKSVESSVDKDEEVLPGLGVLFELVWKNSSKDEKSKLIDKLKDAF